MRVRSPKPSAILCIVGLAAFVGSVWAQDPPPPAKESPPIEKRIAEQVRHLSQKADLTEEQQEQIKAILQETMRRLEALRRELRELQRHTQEMIHEKLAEAQRAKLEREPEKPRARPPREEVDRPRRPQAPVRAKIPRLVRGLRGLDLTQDQRAEIREILRSRPENPREAIVKVLTDQQKRRLARLARAQRIRPRPEERERPTQPEARRRERRARRPEAREAHKRPEAPGRVKPEAFKKRPEEEFCCPCCKECKRLLEECRELLKGRKGPQARERMRERMRFHMERRPGGRPPHAVPEEREGRGRARHFERGPRGAPPIWW